MSLYRSCRRPVFSWLAVIYGTWPFRTAVTTGVWAKSPRLARWPPRAAGFGAPGSPPACQGPAPASRGQLFASLWRTPISESARVARGQSQPRGDQRPVHDGDRNALNNTPTWYFFLKFSYERLTRKLFEHSSQLCSLLRQLIKLLWRLEGVNKIKHKADYIRTLSFGQGQG